MYLTEARRRGRGTRREKHSVPELALGDTRLSIWEERDRAHVELINAKNDATVIEWWDEQVAEAVQDGFLKPGKMHQSAYDYAVHVGLIRRPGARENPVRGNPTTDVHGALTHVRWSVKTAPDISIGDQWTVRLGHADKVFTLTLTYKGVSPWKQRTVQLSKEDVETRGKSMWMTDNTWRMSSSGVEKFAPQIEKAIEGFARRSEGTRENPAGHAHPGAYLPINIGDKRTFEAHGQRYTVKYHSRNTYVLNTEPPGERRRWGSRDQIMQDIAYVFENGALPPTGRSKAFENPANGAHESKGDYEVWVDGKELLYSGPNRSEANYRFIMAAVNYKIGNVVERNNKHVELMVIGARGKRETMADSTKLTDRQLQQRWEQKGSGFSFRENPVVRRDEDTSWAVEWINPTTKKRQIYLDDLSERTAEIEARTLRMHHPNADVRVVRRGFETRENPVEARDFNDTEDAISAAAHKFGSTHYDYRGPNESVRVFSPVAPSGFSMRVLFFKKGRYHWPRESKHVKKIPDGAISMTPDLRVRVLESGAKECACEHCVRENPVGDDGIPWVKTERDPKIQEELVEVQNNFGPIAGSKDIYRLLGPWALKQNQENLLAVLLDIHSELIGVALIHKGQRDRVSVDPADVLAPAIKRGAKGLILSHNHPSGRADHSDADADLTKAIKKACETNDISFIDHIVLGTGEYYSFADKKLHRVKQ